jgi:hypothetical protein
LCETFATCTWQQRKMKMDSFICENNLFCVCIYVVMYVEM